MEKKRKRVRPSLGYVRQLEDMIESLLADCRGWKCQYRELEERKITEALNEHSLELPEGFGQERVKTIADFLQTVREWGVKSAEINMRLSQELDKEKRTKDALKDELEEKRKQAKDLTELWQRKADKLNAAEATIKNMSGDYIRLRDEIDRLKKRGLFARLFNL